MRQMAPSHGTTLPERFRVTLCLQFLRRRKSLQSYSRKMTQAFGNVGTKRRAESGLRASGRSSSRRLFFRFFKTEKITPHQAKALSLLFRINLSNGAHATLSQGIADAYENDFFFRGSKRALTTVKELEPLNGALGMGSVGKINFVSPETGLEYAPDLSSAIRSLVHQGKNPGLRGKRRKAEGPRWPLSQ